jgi:hypothetical protein
MYNDNDDDDRSNLTKAVIMALITSTFVISLISFSCNAEAQIFGDDNNNHNPGLVTELFTNNKQSAVTVNIATTTDPSNTMTNVVPSLITRSYMHPYIGITGGFDATPESVKAAIGSRETRGFLVSDTTTTAEGPAAKAGIKGDDLLADIRGSYIEVSRIINIPKDMPNSSSISVPNTNSGSSVPNSTNLTNATIPNSTNLTNAILTYQNSSYGIRIQYPANWTKDERDFTPNNTSTDIVAFYSPVENTLDNYSESFVIYTKRLADQNMTLEENAASLITYYNETLTDFNLIESNTNITLGGGNNTHPAYGLIFTDRKDNINYKRMEIGTIIGDKAYFIRYNAEENKYSKYLPTIQMMINSLQIT